MCRSAPSRVKCAPSRRNPQILKPLERPKRRKRQNDERKESAADRHPQHVSRPCNLGERACDQCADQECGTLGRLHGAEECGRGRRRILTAMMGKAVRVIRLPIALTTCAIKSLRKSACLSKLPRGAALPLCSPIVNRYLP